MLNIYSSDVSAADIPTPESPSPKFVYFLYFVDKDLYVNYRKTPSKASGKRLVIFD